MGQGPVWSCCTINAPVIRASGRVGMSENGGSSVFINMEDSTKG